MSFYKNLLFVIIPVFLLINCKNDTVLQNSAENIRWVNIQEALDFQNEEGKRYLVHIRETDSCKWCKVMDENGFTFKPLIKYVNENYIPVKFSTLHKDSVVFKGETYRFLKFGNFEMHALADQWLHGWYDYPSTIIFDKDFNQILKFYGYKDPDQFLLELKKL